MGDILVPDALLNSGFNRHPVFQRLALNTAGARALANLHLKRRSLQDPFSSASLTFHILVYSREGEIPH